MKTCMWLLVKVHLQLYRFVLESGMIFTLKRNRNSQVFLAEIKAKTQKKKQNLRTTHGIKVKGEEDVLVRLARCCNPLPGDEIVGYITRGRGISVHRNDCANVQNLSEEEQARIVEVAWDEDYEE